ERLGLLTRPVPDGDVEARTREVARDRLPDGAGAENRDSGHRSRMPAQPRFMPCVVSRVCARADALPSRVVPVLVRRPPAADGARPRLRRKASRAAAGRSDGHHEIPLLTTGDGGRFEGTDAVFGVLRALAP